MQTANLSSEWVTVWRMKRSAVLTSISLVLGSIALNVNGDVSAVPSVTTATTTIQDTTPPSISSVSVSDTSVDVSCGDRFVEVQWRVADSESGLGDVTDRVRATNPVLAWVSGGSPGPEFGFVGRTSGTNLDGTFVSYLKVNKFTSPGVLGVGLTAKDLGGQTTSVPQAATINVINNPSCSTKYPAKKLKVKKSMKGSELSKYTYLPNSSYWVMGLWVSKKSSKVCKVAMGKPTYPPDFTRPSGWTIKALSAGTCILSVSYWNVYQETAGVSPTIKIKVVK